MRIYGITIVVFLEDIKVIRSSDGHPLPETHKITIRGRIQKKNLFLFSGGNFLMIYILQGHETQFYFTAPEAGDYMTCFWAHDHKPSVNLTVDFDWRSGVAAKDWPSVAEKGQIDFPLHLVESRFRFIHSEIHLWRKKCTAIEMVRLGFCSLFVCLAEAGLQLWHLKNFFERKKLL
ncbi:hypothetical protein MKX03_029638 [Papaver bracteatum]|nr:hypothetical protein MKX03_029638 [Papaver bracteatum]